MLQPEKENRRRLDAGEPFLTDLEFKELLKQIFNEETKKFIPGAVIGEGPCDGSIKTVKPKYDIFGSCFELSCECE